MPLQDGCADDPGSQAEHGQSGRYANLLEQADPIRRGQGLHAPGEIQGQAEQGGYARALRGLFAGELSATLGYKLEDDVPLSRVALLTSGKVSRKIFDA